MKKIILVVATTFIANIAMAQSLKFGVKGGVVFNTEKGEAWNDATKNIYKKDGKTSNGFQVGLLSRASLLGFYVQPELLYTQFKNDFDVEGQSFKVTKKRLDIPVNVGKKFLGIAHIQAGPVFSYYFDDKISLNDVYRAKQDDFNVGMQIGAGVEVSKLLLDLRYEFAFGKTTSRFINDEYSFAVENRQRLLNLTIAYLF